jgi:hypothetical protein
MIIKTAMGIATKNLAAWADGSLFGAFFLRADCDQARVQSPPKKAIVPMRPALLLLMPDPVNA